MQEGLSRRQILTGAAAGAGVGLAGCTASDQEMATITASDLTYRSIDPPPDGPIHEYQLYRSEYYGLRDRDVLLGDPIHVVHTEDGDELTDGEFASHATHMMYTKDALLEWAGTTPFDDTLQILDFVVDSVDTASNIDSTEIIMSTIDAFGVDTHREVVSDFASDLGTAGHNVADVLETFASVLKDIDMTEGIGASISDILEAIREELPEHTSRFNDQIQTIANDDIPESVWGDERTRPGLMEAREQLAELSRTAEDEIDWRYVTGQLLPDVFIDSEPDRILPERRRRREYDPLPGLIGSIVECANAFVMLSAPFNRIIIELEDIEDDVRDLTLGTGVKLEAAIGNAIWVCGTIVSSLEAAAEPLQEIYTTLSGLHETTNEAMIDADRTVHNVNHYEVDA